MKIGIGKVEDSYFNRDYITSLDTNDKTKFTNFHFLNLYPSNRLRQRKLHLGAVVKHHLELISYVPFKRKYSKLKGWKKIRS